VWFLLEIKIKGKFRRITAYVKPFLAYLPYFEKNKKEV
jgi:hypothetical protein